MAAGELPPPAAFGRLCVETRPQNNTDIKLDQPPSGGCVLKRISVPTSHLNQVQEQPPSGGCVLKRIKAEIPIINIEQPPSGGCVLKPARQRSQ